VLFIRKPAWGVAPALAAVAAAVYAGVSFRGVPPDVTTLMSGWEQRFSLEWTVRSPSGLGVPALPARDVAAQPLLVQALDASGAMVARRIWAIPGGVAGGQRACFEIPDLPPAHEYRVFVWDYSLIQS
jgi:hypothetical protein